MEFSSHQNATETLYEEIKEDDRTFFKCSLCFRKLSRLQRIESHLRIIHGKGEEFKMLRSISGNSYCLHGIFHENPSANGGVGTESKEEWSQLSFLLLV